VKDDGIIELAHEKLKIVEGLENKGEETDSLKVEESESK